MSEEWQINKWMEVKYVKGVIRWEVQKWSRSHLEVKERPGQTIYGTIRFCSGTWLGGRIVDPNNMPDHIVIIFLRKLWKNLWWVAQAYCGHILIKFMKETQGFFQRVAQRYIGGFSLINFLSGPLYPNAPSVLSCAFPRPASPTSSTYTVGCLSPM